MPRSDHDFDLLVIGSGPGGQRAAVQAAKLGRRVAVVERRLDLGGVSANTGTIPSKTLRAAILDLTGLERYSVYGDAYRVKDDISLDDLTWRVRRVIEHERLVVRDQLRRNHVRTIAGTAAFVDAHTVEVRGDLVSAANIVIAVGTVPVRPAGVDFDERTVVDSDGLLRLERVPDTMTVVGAGVIGMEYASMAAALGIRVTVVDKRPVLLDFVDDEIVDSLRYHLRELRVDFRLGEAVAAVERRPDGVAVTRLESGKRIPSEVVLYTAGRRGAVDHLRLEAAGLSADARGLIAVDAHFRTAQPHIFAVGDVIGFPSLAATSAEQGRLAALAAFGLEPGPMRETFPFGIYTIPEISMVGRTEEDLTGAGVHYVTGAARYREVARGEIAGDEHGLLKLLVNADTRTFEGVHIVGTAATELIHIGQVVMDAGLPVDYLVDAVFNYPTFADAYKVGALDAANRLDALDGRRRLSRAV